MTTDITPEIREAGTAIERKAQDITIVTAKDYTEAGEWLKALKTYRAMVEEKFGSPTKAAHDAWKKMVALRKEVDTPADNAERMVKQKMGAWSAEQERVRLEQQRKAEEAARKEAEKLREAEAKRLEREATKAQKKGDVGTAAELVNEALERRDAPLEVAPVVVQTMVPKVAGISIRKAWDFKVVDPNAIPRQYLIVDEGKIGKVVRALRGEHGIPGIEAFEVTTTAAGRG